MRSLQLDQYIGYVVYRACKCILYYVEIGFGFIGLNNSMYSLEISGDVLRYRGFVGLAVFLGALSWLGG